MTITIKNILLTTFVMSSIITFLFFGYYQKNFIIYIIESAKGVNCSYRVPCVYEKNVDLRIIVLTFNRPESVMKLLNNLQSLELDGDEAVLEIWIDRNAKGEIDNATYRAVSGFKWKKGLTRVHNQSKSARIMGQWIDTWRPKGAPPFQRKNMTNPMYKYDPLEYKEIGLILEDDLMVSPHAYRFLKAVHKKYGGRLDYAGVTLNSDEVYAHNNHRALIAPKNESVFYYACFGTWGFAPAPQYWAEFQDWFHFARNQTPTFHPLVEGIVPNNDYKYFLALGAQDAMWEMWYIYFMIKKNLFTIFSNLNRFNGDKPDSCVGINRREKGLHYQAKGPENLCKLLQRWDANYTECMPDEPVKLDYNGNVVVTKNTLKLKP